MPGHLGTAVLLALVATACGDASAPRDPGFSVRDSAGVRLVENGSAPTTHWRLTDEPRLVIGGDESDAAAQLHYVTSAARRPTGEIVVANSGTSEIFVFDSVGRRTGTYGRKGPGPGEFSGVGFLSLLAPGPQPLTAEYRGLAWKLVRFDSAGRPSETALTIDPKGAIEDAWTSPGGVGFFVNHPGLSPDMPAASEEVTRHPAMLVRFTYEGEGPDTVARFPGVGLFFVDIGPRMALGGGTVAGPSPLSPLAGPKPRAAGGGDPWRVIAGDQARPEVDVFSEAGAHIMRIRWNAVGREFSRADAARVQEEYLLRPFGRREPAAARRALQAMPSLERTPVFESLLVDRTGASWVQRYRLPSDTSDLWWVFDPAGRLVATASLPREWRILEIGQDYMLVLVRDELDVQRLELWGLQRGPPGDGA